MTKERTRGFGAEVRDLLAHANRSHHKPPWRIEPPLVRGEPVEVTPVAIAERPFCTLLRFVRAGAGGDPAVLVVAPWSGHFAVLLQDLVNALLPDHDVFLTDWKDAAAVPLDRGRFGLDELIAYVIEFLRTVGPETHVIAMSQSGVPVVAAASLMAAAGEGACPRSMTLMGGFIDTRIHPTGMNRMAKSLFANPWVAGWSERALIRPVGADFPGAGRRVHPASLQFAGLALYLTRRLRPRTPTPLDVFQQSLIGDGAKASTRRAFFDTFLTLMDLPAELYLETIRALFCDHLLARGEMTWRGVAVDPAAITRTALMTVEAERDDISGNGQTEAAHGLCPNIPDGLRERHFEPRIGHLGMFHGRCWRSHVLPRFHRFIRAPR
ncbi:MAG: polyhydroxyalkanoate depolymerase [Alphaproteobacteria bacterium]